MIGMKTKILILCLSILVALIFIAPRAAAFDLFGSSCTGEAAKSAVCQDRAKGTTNPIAGPNGLISKVANVVAVVGGIIAVIMIIISGFMFMTAGGTPVGQRSTDPNQLKKARATLFGAIVGLVVIALAWTITRFVTDKIIP
jgi:hypothetical protein